MRNVFISLLLIVVSTVAHGAPSISCTDPAGGRAPLYIPVNCTATTDGTDPFHQLLYTTTVTATGGGTTSGTFSYGTRAGLSKAFFTGAVGAFIAETAGVYTLTTCASDGINRSCVSKVVTVTAWPADATTVCVANGALPVAGENDCPAGATVKNQSSLPTIIQYLTTGTSCDGAVLCKRVLLRKGDTFTGAANTTITVTGPAMIGAYGLSGAKPVLRTTGTTAGDRIIRFGGTVSDLRLVDLDIDGEGDGRRQGVELDTSGAISDLLMLRLDIHDIGGGIEIPLERQSTVAVRIALAGSTIRRLNSAGSSTHGILLGSTHSSITDNLFDDSTAGSAEHMIRIQLMRYGVIQNNTIQLVQSSKEMIAFRAPCSAACPTGSGSYFPALGLTGADAASAFAIISNNNIKTNSYVGINIGQVNSNDSTILNNIIVESNFFAPITGGGAGITSLGSTTSIRNNVIDASQNSRNGVAISGATAGMPTPPDKVWITNNTYYSSTANNDHRAISLASATTNISVINNLAYSPNSTGNVTVFDSGSTAPTLSANSTSSPSGGQMKNTSPQFELPLTQPKGFRPSIASYAATGGTAVFPASNDDFFNCDDVTANAHIGAMVPRARATCRGVK